MANFPFFLNGDKSMSKCNDVFNQEKNHLVVMVNIQTSFLRRNHFSMLLAQHTTGRHGGIIVIVLPKVLLL